MTKHYIAPFLINAQIHLYFVQRTFFLTMWMNNYFTRVFYLGENVLHIKYQCIDVKIVCGKVFIWCQLPTKVSTAAPSSSYGLVFTACNPCNCLHCHRCCREKLIQHCIYAPAQKEGPTGRTFNLYIRSRKNKEA